MREATVCLVRLETILLIVSNWEKFSVWLKRRTQQLNLPFDQSVIGQKPMRRLIVQEPIDFHGKIMRGSYTHNISLFEAKKLHAWLNFLLFINEIYRNLLYQISQ